MELAESKQHHQSADRDRDRSVGKTLAGWTALRVGDTPVPEVDSEVAGPLG